jgi:hypothetical protein
MEFTHLKRQEKLFLTFYQKELLKKINGGKLNKAKLITSVIAYTNKDLKIRLVFVKARNSTD